MFHGVPNVNKERKIKDRYKNKKGIVISKLNFILFTNLKLYIKTSNNVVLTRL
jgi:hypothetical protein